MLLSEALANVGARIKDEDGKEGTIDETSVGLDMYTTCCNDFVEHMMLTVHVDRAELYCPKCDETRVVPQSFVDEAIEAIKIQELDEAASS